LTVRENTERPVTIEQGTNQLIGRDTDLLLRSAREALSAQSDSLPCPPLWDGHAAERIVQVLAKEFSN
jgi:UDP-N-acetylglucosamine 2-epimerase (non-hydrolysing)